MPRPIHQILVIVRIIARDLRIFPGERPDGIYGSPPAQRGHLARSVAEVAQQDLEAEVAGGVRKVATAGRHDVMHVIVALAGPDATGPLAKDRGGFLHGLAPKFPADIKTLYRRICKGAKSSA